MAQNINIASAETKIARHAFDVQPDDPLAVTAVEVASINGTASGAALPDWFRFETTDVSTASQARVRLTVFVRAYDAAADGVEQFTFTAAATDGVNAPVTRTWTVELVPFDTTVAAATGLAAEAGTEEVALSWTSSTDEDLAAERLYRSETSPIDPEGSPSEATLLTTVTGMAPGASQSFTNVGLTPGTTYHYVVQTEDTAGNTTLSSEASAVPHAPDTTVAAATSLTATADDGEMALAWTTSADTDLAAERLYRSETSPVDPEGNPGAAMLVQTVNAPASSAAQSFTDAGLTNGTTYFYVAQTEDTTGNTALSAEASGAPAATVESPPANVLFVQSYSPEGQNHDYAAGTTSALAGVANTTNARGIFVDPARENDLNEPWLFICDRDFGVYAYTGTDLQSLKEVWATAITDAYGVAVAPTSGRIFASSYSSGTIYELDRADGAATVATTALPSPMHLSIDEATGYVFAGGNTTIDRFNLDWQTAVGATTLLSGLTSAFGIEVDPTTSTLYLAHDGGLDSCAYDGSGRTNITTFTSQTANDVAIDADMGLAFVTHSIFLREINLATGTQTQLASAGTNNFTRGLTLYPNERVYEGTYLLDAESLVHVVEGPSDTNDTPSLEGSSSLVHLTEETEPTDTPPSLEGSTPLVHIAGESASTNASPSLDGDPNLIHLAEEHA